MRNPAMAAMAASLVSLATPARAEGKRASSLAWVRLEGADSCIAAPALAQRVEGRLGRKVFVSASDADLTVEGAIGPSPKGGFRAQLRVSSKDGSLLGARDIETRAATCDAIDEKLSLVVSVMIDPDATPRADQPSAAPPAPSAPEVMVRERIVVVREDPPRAAPPWRFELTLATMATLGLQPGPGLAFAPSIILSPPRFWALRVAGGIAASSSVAAAEGATVEASLAHVSVAVCPLAARGSRLRALVCAGGLVGALRGRGIGFDTTMTTSSLVAGPVLLGRASLRIAGPLLASAALGLGVPVAHAELGYRTPSGSGSLFRTAPVAATTELGVGVEFP